MQALPVPIPTNIPVAPAIAVAMRRRLWEGLSKSVDRKVLLLCIVRISLHNHIVAAQPFATSGESKMRATNSWLGRLSKLVKPQTWPAWVVFIAAVALFLAVVGALEAIGVSLPWLVVFVIAVIWATYTTMHPKSAGPYFTGSWIGAFVGGILGGIWQAISGHSAQSDGPNSFGANGAYLGFFFGFFLGIVGLTIASGFRRARRK